jgi:hypothetical protein
VLGLDPGASLRVALRHGEEGFRVARVNAEAGRPAPRGPFNREEMEARMKANVRGIFDHIGEYARNLLERLVRDGRIRPDQRERLREKIQKLQETGKIEYRIIDEETKIGPGHTEVVVRCADLAELLGLRDDRFVVEFRRRPGGRGMLAPRIRPAGR